MGTPGRGDRLRALCSRRDRNTLNANALWARDSSADLAEPGCPQFARHAFGATKRDRRRHLDAGRRRESARNRIPEYPRSASDCSLRAVNHLSVWLPRLTHWLFLCGHFRASIYQGGTMSDVTIPGGKIRAFVERIENIDTELQELNEQKKEVFAEAKGEGFDVKILKEIVKLRKQDKEERDERESLLDLYMRAMEQAGPEKVAKAA